MAYIIKATIEDTHPPVWRRIRIPEKISFFALHEILQTVFGWEEGHMHAFSFPGTQVEIGGKGDGCADALEDDIAVDDFFPCCNWIRYTYDFGDDWRHKIVLEKTVPDNGERCACVLKAKGDNFEEDCGGVWGASEENRIPFDMDAVNGRLAGRRIPKMASSDESRDLAEQVRFAKETRDGLKSFRKEFMRKAAEFLNGLDMDTMRDMAEGLGESPSRSVRNKMIIDLREYLDEAGAYTDGFRMQINFQEPNRTVRDMLSELGEKEKTDYCKYLRLDCGADAAPEEKVNAIWQTYQEHPEYLLYTIRKEELPELRKFLKIPDKRSCESKEIDLVVVGIALGILDAAPNRALGNGVISLRFASDAGALFDSLSETEVKACYKELDFVEKGVSSLLETFGVIEFGELWEQYKRIYHRDISQKDFDRYVYWHFRLLDKAQSLVAADGKRYASASLMDVESILMDMMEYAKDIPYKQFQKKQLISRTSSIGELYPFWGGLWDIIYEHCGGNEEAANEWCDEAFDMVREGGSVNDLFSILADSFQLDTIVIGVECWALFTRLCLETPIPMLKGHTRQEYSKLTGKRPWESGLYDDDHFASEDCGLFYLTAQKQYELYDMLTKEANEASDILTVRRMVESESEPSVELRYVLMLSYLKNGMTDRAEQLLRKLYKETSDPGLAEVRKMFRQSKAGAAPNRNRSADSDADMPMADVIPFQRDKPKIGRNAPCPCGSGKKFKNCCLGKGIYD